MSCMGNQVESAYFYVVDGITEFAYYYEAN